MGLIVKCRSKCIKCSVDFTFIILVNYQSNAYFRKISSIFFTLKILREKIYILKFKHSRITN